MTKYSGNYKGNIDLSAADDVSELVSVAGSVHVCQGATLNAPKLQEARKVSA